MDQSLQNELLAVQTQLHKLLHAVWEYKDFEIDLSQSRCNKIEETCNDYGLYGWELMSVTFNGCHARCVFKRRKP